MNVKLSLLLAYRLHYCQTLRSIQLAFGIFQNFKNISSNNPSSVEVNIGDGNSPGFKPMANLHEYAIRNERTFFQSQIVRCTSGSWIYFEFAQMNLKRNSSWHAKCIASTSAVEVRRACAVRIARPLRKFLSCSQLCAAQWTLIGSHVLRLLALTCLLFVAVERADWVKHCDQDLATAQRNQQRARQKISSKWGHLSKQVWKKASR